MNMNKLDWFHTARYGMFVHWGPYAVAGRGEWVMNRERIPLEEYRRLYAEQWQAANYDPRAWCELAREAGMGYIVLTTRHHDGFCLWDSQTTEWNAARIGPKRDLVRPFVEAAREAGLKIGFYYSVADWSHADYPGAYFRDWPEGWTDEAARGRFVVYYRAQLEELMTRYGKIDMLWYDGCIPDPMGGADTNARIYELQPDILINERNGQPFDLHISEQAIKPAAPGVAWEACLTLNENWGFHAGDDNWKSPREVVQMLLECTSSAGNLLLNVGPQPDGTIPEPSVRILREAGAWLQRNGEFLSNSSRSPFTWNNWGRVTTKGNTAYVHLWNNPGPQLCWAECRNRVLSARILPTNEALTFEQNGERLTIDLPQPLPDSLVTTLALELEGEPQAFTPQTSFWIPG